MECRVEMLICWLFLAFSAISVLSFVWPMKDPNGCDGDKRDRKLILISLDGFRWDYIYGRARTPTFEYLKRKGVHAPKGMMTSFISNTLPNHFTLATGLYPESHGMLDNTMYDREMDSVYLPVFFYHYAHNDPRWYSNFEPIWVTNQIQRQGGRSGVLMWMGADSPIKGIIPHRFILHTYEMDEIIEMKHLVNWLTDEREPVNLALAYFPQPDDISHAHGPDSVEVTRKIEYLDEALKYLLEELDRTGLTPVTDVIVLADHGFTSVSKDKIINLDNILERGWYITVSKMPASTVSVFPNEGYLEVVYDKLQKAAEDSGTFNVYKAHDIPERFHLKNHKRVPPIFAMANLNYSFVTSDELHIFETFRGNHGYDNSHPLMRPIFMAIGPSFKENVTLDNFRNVDVYPLMCHLLGIKPQPNNGSLEASRDILREGSRCIPSLTINYYYFCWCLLGMLIIAVLLSAIFIQQNEALVDRIPFLISASIPNQLKIKANQE